jgi:aspartyl-tRNA(Asn)/glutamyl-tRNA(Gln) amidotransferase subunit A
VIPTIAEAARLIERKALSPVELTAECSVRIEQLQPVIHAFVTPTLELAFEQARAAEREIARGGYRGPLHGIPIGLKDIFNTAGIRTTANSRQLINNVPQVDATTVRKLADAGTILMGKLTLHEFALGGPSFDLPWPPARNPWNTERHTGGSSSGTGAAVAAGLVLGGTGTDTGGSIRSPAAYCGLSGMKPTYGRVSKAGIVPLSFSLDHAGPMAWTAEDCALLLQAMAGYDVDDPTSANAPVPDFCGELEGSIRGVRIGVVRHFFERDNPIHPITHAALEAAIGELRGAGAQISDVTLPPLVEWTSCLSILNMSESFTIHRDLLRTHLKDYGERLRDRLLLGATISASDYIAATRRRRQLCSELASTMQDVDILLTAAVGSEAPLIADVPKWGGFDKPSYLMPFNLSGTPAMAICIGFGANGLPLSMQLAGKPFAEPTIFRVAHAYEKLTQWRSQRPRLNVPDPIL